MSELLKLADACEAATGPDRELDALIAPLVGLRLVDEGHPLGRCCYDENNRNVPLPSFTRSIDAAMTLVPEGHQFGVENYPWSTHPSGNKACAWAGNGGNSGIEQTGRIPAATPALALCAAALRALAAQEPSS